MSDQADKDPANSDDTMQAPPPEEPQTTIIASDTTMVDRAELAWSQETDELEIGHRPWTEVLKITGIILACAVILTLLIGGSVWIWHKVKSDSAAPARAPTSKLPTARQPTSLLPMTPSSTRSSLPPPVPTPTSAPPGAIVNPDISYLDQLRQLGLTVSNPASAVAVGRTVCAKFQDGLSKIDVVQYVAEQEPVGHMSAGYIVDAATTAFCPQYASTP